MGAVVELMSSDGVRVPAYVAVPQGPVRGAVVVLQEIFGVNSHIRSVADGYAAAGYLAVAPSTFQRAEPGVELGYAEEDMKRGFALKMAVEGLPMPGVMADIQAAVAYAGQRAGGKVAVVGYCWGGLLTWRAACGLEGISAAVPYYGGGMTGEAEAARQPRCPVMAHFGETDHWIPLDTVRGFQTAHTGVQVHVYAANHGFNCDQRGAYNAEAAQLARERTLAFIAQHLA